MRKRLTILIFLLCALPVFAVDLDNGRNLHDEYCLQCHQTELYKRDDRQIKDIKHLRSQVLFCSVNNNLYWFDEEVEDVTAYLNTFYYLFAKE